jgi:hypothetical protein
MTRFKTSKYTGDTQKRKKEIKVLFMNRRIYHMDMRPYSKQKDQDTSP